MQMPNFNANCKTFKTLIVLPHPYPKILFNTIPIKPENLCGLLISMVELEDLLYANLFYLLF